jgi:hypothetical protein
MGLKPLGVMELFRCQSFEMMENTLEDVSEVLGAVAPLSADISCSGGRIQFNGNNACTILTPVTHLLQQKL